MKAKFNDKFEAVKEVIHRWDPYNLLESGAPQDEFDMEIMAVVRQINKIHSPVDATHVISRIFSSAFEPELFQIKHCQDVGKELYESLIKHRVIE